MGVDLMWFRYFKNDQGQNLPFLFFSRNRASTDYKYSPTAFGSTNAVSFNFSNGMGLVAVGSFLNTGFTPKLGFQWVKIRSDFLFFGWLVADIKPKGNIDFFGLFRWQPRIQENWRMFFQCELFPVFHPANRSWNITERFRLGPQWRSWQGGLMLDLNQFGVDRFTTSQNLGIFLRHDF